MRIVVLPTTFSGGTIEAAWVSTDGYRTHPLPRDLGVVDPPMYLRDAMAGMNRSLIICMVLAVSTIGVSVPSGRTVAV